MGGRSPATAGVDAGKSGAVAVLGPAPGAVWVTALPVLGDGRLDVPGFLAALAGRGVGVLGVEACFRPVPLVWMAGGIAALGEALPARVAVVQPAAWKRKVLGEATADKAASVARCRELFPGADLIPPGCRVPDHNRAEAVLIAHAVKLLYPELYRDV